MERRTILARGPSSKNSHFSHVPNLRRAPTASRRRVAVSIQLPRRRHSPLLQPIHHPTPANPSRPKALRREYIRRHLRRTSARLLLRRRSEFHRTRSTTPIARTINRSTLTTIPSYPSTSIANDDSHFSNSPPWKSPRPCWNSTASTC